MPRSRSAMALLLLILFQGSGRAQALESPAGIAVRFDAKRGAYEVSWRQAQWKIGGVVGDQIEGVGVEGGRDRIGPYRELSFSLHGARPVKSAIRVYFDRPVVLFVSKTTTEADVPMASFPVLSGLPAGLLTFRYSEETHLGPPVFDLRKDSASVPYCGPLVLFDEHANTCILSPAADFMIADVSGNLTDGIGCGLDSRLMHIPKGYVEKAILVFGRGINATFDEWGNALTDLCGKRRPSSDADPGLRYLGYWTDNGAAYYYNYEPGLGYEGTLLALRRHEDSLGIPLRYMQIDSWWYPKSFTSFDGSIADSMKPHSRRLGIPPGRWNRYGGMLEYTADSTVFPHGLGAFQKRIQLPLVTHDRWIDPASPYHARYRISGLAAVDRGWWEHIIGGIASQGVTTYEQDWLSMIYSYSPELSTTTGAGESFMNGMASATAKRGMTMQYCMVLPRHVMQGGCRYSNLTTVRTSDDRFSPERYRNFLYGSRFASALGIYPWADVFRSDELGNMLLSTLSAGMVGIGDFRGSENVENIFRVVRADGVIVKPDVPMTPLDTTFIADAKGEGLPLVAATYTEHSARGITVRARYLFAYRDPAIDGGRNRQAQLSPAMLGMRGEVFVYDYFTGKGRAGGSDTCFPAIATGADWTYRVLVPIGPSGIALVGDAGKFVTRGRKRIATIAETGAHLDVGVLFARRERTVTLVGWSPAGVRASSAHGRIVALEHDAHTGIFSAVVARDERGPWSEDGSDPVMRVTVRFEPLP